MNLDNSWENLSDIFILRKIEDVASWHLPAQS